MDSFGFWRTSPGLPRRGSDSPAPFSTSGLRSVSEDMLSSFETSLSYSTDGVECLNWEGGVVQE